MVASFDTGFFAGLPPEAATYAIPAGIARRLSIRRYGFHGLAHRFMSQRIDALSGRRDLRVVTLQLGAGCSAAAIRAGGAIDTSMGFTPLRACDVHAPGDIDPSLPVYIAGATGMSGDEVERMLNEESGLLGLSGISGDVRDLLEAEALGESAAALALAVFCYHIRRYIGAYAAALGGLDAIGFGGGIGENSPEIRERVCRGLEWLGLSIDEAANQRCRGLGGLISSQGSRVACHVIAVDEAQVIAADTLRCLGERGLGKEL
jgi:acetate kinase